jgi:hypothetical protein
MDKANLPWSIKGISQEARHVAKDLAAEAGQPMGAWLSAVIHTISRLERAEAAGDQPTPPPPAADLPAAAPIAADLIAADLIAAEPARSYDTADFGGGRDELAILAQRIAKAERWTARSVGPLRQAIESITRRLDALEHAVEHHQDGPSDGSDGQPSRRRWRP